MFKNSKKGFTLIELLVVIAIIGILSSVVLASLNSARKKSRDARRVADVKQLQLALELFFDSNKKYPAALSELSSGGFIPAIPTDPTSGTYTYAYYPTSGDPLYYHLGATLEESTNSAFSSDKDCDSADNTPACGGGGNYTNGFDGAGLVYDVTP